MRTPSCFVKVRRRIPTQERGKRRVQAILEAAAEVFAEVGFDNATMDAIAERADSSVGSIYQFFRNKDALFAAIAEACIAKSGDLFETLLTEELLASDWETIVGTFLDRYLAWERNDPFIRAIYSNLHLYRSYEETDIAMTRYLIDRTAELVTLYTPNLTPKHRHLIATTVINVFTSFLFLARRETEETAAAMLGETKVLLIRYLRPYVAGE